MEIKEDLSWTLQVGESTIVSDSRQLYAQPQTLNSVSKVRRSIDGLEIWTFCTGNNEMCCTLLYLMSAEIICPNLQ